MKSRLLFLAAALSLAACATPPQGQWEKNGVSLSQRASDHSGCASHVRMGAMSAEVAQDLLHLCMQAKGYRLKSTDRFALPAPRQTGAVPKTAGIAE